MNVIIFNSWDSAAKKPKIMQITAIILQNVGHLSMLSIKHATFIQNQIHIYEFW